MANRKDTNRMDRLNALRDPAKVAARMAFVPEVVLVVEEAPIAVVKVKKAKKAKKNVEG